MDSRKKVKTIRKTFSKKKELIKYLIDADSNAEEYIVEIPVKMIPIKTKERKKVA